jgi:hypothetical protein
MARPRLHPWWRDEIRKMAEAYPGIKATAVVRHLSEEIAKETLKIPVGVRPNVPEERTVRGILREYATLDSKDRIPYRYFQWPESMIAGFLPWEASAALMDLLRYLQEQRNEQRKKQSPDPNTVWTDNRLVRPTISEALWFWRVTQAIPEALISKRLDMALGLLSCEQESFQPKTSGVLRSIEGMLVRKTYLTQVEKSPELPTKPQAAVETHFAWVSGSKPKPKTKTRAKGGKRS